MNLEKFLRVLESFRDTCYEVDIYPNHPIRLEVLQFSGKSVVATNAEIINRAASLAEFYNKNWLGNADFMHIPDFISCYYNYLNFPIVVARNFKNDEIVASEIVKFEENNSKRIAPYFPVPNVDFFKITGLLVKKDAGVRGLGKKLYETAIRGAYNYHKTSPETMLICLIDCRNNMSISALNKVLDVMKIDGGFLDSKIIGFYELRNPNTKELAEAPTLVVKIELEPTEKVYSKPYTIEFNGGDSLNLYQNLTNQLHTALAPFNVSPSPIETYDAKNGLVDFYWLENELATRNLKIITNGTELGNDRHVETDQNLEMHSCLLGKYI
ncbi:MAG: hypothetical protein IJ538_03705 [Clostridia bacterium]|nr:hypothetical protein [Clostridia bacterium]